MFRLDFDDSSGSLKPSECDKMTVMTLPKKLQKDRRIDATHDVKCVRDESVAKVGDRSDVKSQDGAADDVEENCPVIRANRIVFSAGRTGRTRVVFY